MNTQRTHALALASLSKPPASPEEEFPASEAYQRALDVSRTARATLRSCTEALRRSNSQHAMPAVRPPGSAPGTVEGLDAPGATDAPVSGVHPRPRHGT